MKNHFLVAHQWKRILLEIYKHSPNAYLENHNSNFWDDKHALAKRLNILGSELGISIEFLRENKLIEDTNPLEPMNEYAINPDWSNLIYLTEKGFNVVFELDKQFREIKEKKRFERLQRWIIILTAVLAFTGVVNIFF